MKQSLEWLSLSETEAFLRDRSIKWYGFNRSVKKFLQKYLTVNDWFDIPLESMESIGEHKKYIAIWATVNGVFHDQRSGYAQKVINYLLKDRGSSVVVWTILAKSLGFLSDTDIESFNEIKKLGLNDLALHTILLSKPLKEFTDQDIWVIPEIYIYGRYSAIALGNLRIKLKYSDKPVRVQRKKAKEKLREHRLYGNIIAEYVDFLMLSNWKESTIDHQIGSLKKFFKFTDKYAYSNFCDIDYKLLFSYFKQSEKKQAYRHLYCIRHFLQWGIGNPFFPNSLITFPEEELLALRQENNNIYMDSEGHAFQTEGDEKLFAKDVIDFTPSNETEELVRQFWLLQICCPARMGYIRNLEAFSCLRPMANNPNLLGITAAHPDKAGNIYAHYPVFDTIGIEVIGNLQNRALQKGFSQIYNQLNHKRYVHLFQLESYPYLLQEDQIYGFARRIVENNPDLKSRYNETAINPTQRNITPHKFRTHILTEVAKETRNPDAVRIAANHRDNSMQRLYLRNKVSRTALLYTIEEKFRNGELTGKFYFKVIELLSSESPPEDELSRALTTEMTIDEFLAKYGKRHENRIGYCMSQSSCDNWYRCWGCKAFLITRNEIEDAIETLDQELNSFERLKMQSRDFSYDNAIVRSRIRGIALITKRIVDLGLPQEKIKEMLLNRRRGIPIQEALT